MNRIHISISTSNIDRSIEDYTKRTGVAPCSVVEGKYALWRTEILNLSVSCDPRCKDGELRHLGWEDPSASAFTRDTDVNGIVWERFSAQQQADEINHTWPAANYVPG